jgi:heme-degrading monooxygenase HmoA
MILEKVIFSIKPGHAKQFEAGFAEARQVIARAKGFLKCEMRACIEDENKYLLLVWWDNIDSHMKGFRESADFAKWRAPLQDHFNPPTDMQHFSEPL